MAKKKTRKDKIAQIQEKLKEKRAEQAQMQPEGPQGSQLQVPEQLNAAEEVGVIVTNTEPEALLFVTPILRKINKEFNCKVHLHVTKPQEESFLQIIEGLEYIESIVTHKHIDNKTAAEIEKKHKCIIMLNYLAAMQQGLQRGLNAPQAMAALVQIALDQFESLEIDISITNDQIASTKEIFGNDYIVIAPDFLADIDMNYTVPRIWERQKWLEVLHHYAVEREENIVIIAADKLGKEPLMMENIMDNVRVVKTNDAVLVSAIIANSKLVIGVDSGFVQIARALKKKIVHIHSGGPVSWSASMYPEHSTLDGTTRLLAAIDINIIQPRHVIESIDELIGELHD